MGRGRGRGHSHHRRVAQQPASSVGLNMSMEIRESPVDKAHWIGVTFGMGTSTYTVGVPMAQADAFLAMFVETFNGTIAKFNSSKLLTLDEGMGAQLDAMWTPDTPTLITPEQ